MKRPKGTDPFDPAQSKDNFCKEAFSRQTAGRGRATRIQFEVYSEARARLLLVNQKQVSNDRGNRVSRNPLKAFSGGTKAPPSIPMTKCTRYKARGTRHEAGGSRLQT